MEQRVNNPFVGVEGYRCFGCDPSSPVGLRLEFMKVGDILTAEWQPREDLEGYPGIVHGGIQATLADETGGWYLCAVLGVAGVTRELSVTYHATAAVADGPFRITARARSVEPKQAVIEVTIDNAAGVCVAAAVCTYAVFSEAVARKRLRFPGKAAFAGE